MSAGGGRPSWQVGDYWEYEGWENTPVPGAYRHRVDVEAIERRTAGGSGYTAYRLKDAWTFPSGGFIPLRMWQTTDALATVEIQDSLPIMFLGLCVAGSLGPCSSSYSPPATVYGFPLAPGKEWTTVCRGSEAKAREIFERQLRLYSVGLFRLLAPDGRVIEERKASALFACR